MHTSIKSLITFSAIFLATSLWAGVVGTYEIDREALVEAFKEMPDFQSAPEAQQEMMLGMAGQMDLSVVFSAEGTFEAKASMMGQDNEGSGTYEVEGEEVVITTTFENGEEKETPEITRFKLAGDSIVIHEEGMPFGFVLTKSE